MSCAMTGRGSSVLVVEDERKIRDLVRGYLERAGHVVFTTESGAEAIAMARRARPDLVVLDVQLKVFNTTQMNQAVFALHRHEDDGSLRYTGHREDA